MPTGTMPAELYLIHKGIRVYHVYKNDDIENGVRMYWYAFLQYNSEDAAQDFDVRELPTYRKGVDHKKVIIEAIDKEHISRRDRMTVIVNGIVFPADPPSVLERWAPKSHWDNHPDHPAEDWQDEVANNDTRLGYVDWVNHKIETITEMQKPED